jgi:Group II intron, maturase-specific domain
MEYRLRKLGQYLRGWTAYFGISQYYRPVPELDEWIRRRMRMCYWKQWRWARTKIKNLLALGVSLKSAIQHGVSSNSYWQMSRTPVINQAISNAWLKEQGLLSVRTKFQRRLTCTQVTPELKTCGAKRRATRQRKERLRRASQLVEPLNEGPAWWVVWGATVRSRCLPDWASLRDELGAKRNGE